MDIIDKTVSDFLNYYNIEFVHLEECVEISLEDQTLTFERLTNDSLLFMLTLCEIEQVEKEQFLTIIDLINDYSEQGVQIGSCENYYYFYLVIHSDHQTADVVHRNYDLFVDLKHKSLN